MKPKEVSVLFSLMPFAHVLLLTLQAAVCYKELICALYLAIRH